MTHRNAWGDLVDEAKPSSVYLVPEDKRKDTDDDPDANALISDPFDPDSLSDDIG